MELLILLVGVIALVWSFVYARRASVLVSCALLMVAGSCIGHAFFNTKIGPVPFTIDRLLWGGLVVQFIWFQKMRMNDGKPLGRMDIIFFAYVAYLGINTMMSDWQINGKTPLAQWLFYYLVPATVYWIARQAKLDEQQFRFFTAIMTVFGLYLAVTAFAETREWWFMVFPKHIADVTNIEFLGRGRGPFLNPVSCGIFQIFSFCCMLMWWPRTGWRGRTLIVCLSMVFSVGILCTLTRSVWMALAVSLAGMIWLATTNRARGILIAGGTVLAVLGLLITGGDFNSFKRDKHVTTTQMAESAALRPMLAAVACEMAKDKPVFGCGLGQYYENAGPYHFTDAYEMPLRRVREYIQHNMFLASLVETGVIGLLFLLGLMTLWARAGWRLWYSDKAPLFARQIGMLQLVLVATCAINGMFHDTLVIPMGTTLMFLFAGMNSGTAQRFIEVEEEAETESATEPQTAESQTAEPQSGLAFDA